MKYYKKYRALKVAEQGTMFTNVEIKKLLIPLIIEQVLNYLVGFADSLMVSSVGETAVSAVSLVDSISILMVNWFSALAAGGAIVVGQYLGNRDYNNAKYTAKQLVIVLLVLSVFAMILLLTFEIPLLTLLFGKSSAEIQENCRIYYHIVMQSVPFIALYNGGAALFRSVGDCRTPMYISIIMNLVNITGNAILIFGLHFGIEGVAIPTLISRIIAMIIILYKARRSSFTISLYGILRSKINPKLVCQILRYGIPSGIENAMFQIGKIVLFSLVSTLGTASITANAIGNTIAMFHNVVGISVNLGVVSVVSRCVGAQDYKQARWYIEDMIKFVYKSQNIVCTCFLLAAPLIVKAYHVSAEAGHLAIIIMMIHGISALIIWPISFVLPTGIRAAGDVNFVMKVASVSMWLCRVGFGYLFVLVFNTGILGIWYAWIIDWIFRACFFVPRYLGNKWESHSIHFKAQSDNNV